MAELELAPRLPTTRIILPTAPQARSPLTCLHVRRACCRETLSNVSNAPQRSITLNMGMRMNVWYDLYSLDKINDSEDITGLKESLRFGWKSL